MVTIGELYTNLKSVLRLMNIDTYAFEAKLIIEKAKLLNGEKFEPIEIIEGKYIGFFTKIDTLRRFNIVFRECCRVVGTVKGFRITNIIKNKKKETPTETKKETEK